MSRKNALLLVAFSIIIVLSLLPYRHQSLNIIPDDNSFAPAEFRIYTPVWTYFFEPFTGLSDYFQSFGDPQKQFLSWLIWILLVFVISGRRSIESWESSPAQQGRRSIVKISLRAGAAAVVFIVFVSALVLFVPPKFRIVNTNPRTMLIDFHSHTSFSHDGFSGICASDRWHLKRGFDFFYITDHNVNKYRTIAEICDTPGGLKALPGGEIADKYGTHLLILGLTEPVPGRLVNAETSAIISYTHSRGGAVAVAHWWHKKNRPMKELLRLNVDAFEIYGHESTPLDKKTQEDIIEFCAKNSIPAICGTNWHGWGTRNDLWTVVEFNKWQELKTSEINRKIVESLRARKTGIFKVLHLRKNEPSGFGRIFFEPFVGIFYYFLGLNLLQGVSWCVWLTALNFVSRKIYRF